MRRLCTAAFIALFLLQSSGSASGASLAQAPLAEIRIPKSLGITIAQDWLTSHAVVMALLQTRSGMQSSAPDFRSAPRQTPIDPARMRETPRIKPTYTGSGVRLPGPPMLREPLSPQASKRLTPATRPMGTSAKPTARGISAQSVRTQSVTIGSPNNTGINHWWTYEEGAIPGVGKYMVNVANANLVVQSDDMDVPERGIDLAFRRTYNSMSLRDWNTSGGSDDGAPTPGTYGSGWTNTFDAHLAQNTSGGISVFDIDGARYDYAPSGGCLTPPTGQYTTLCSDGGTGYFWTKKTGTVYYFYAPTLGGVSAAYAGRLYQIWARNHNNAITFAYSWAGGDASTTLNLTQIQAQHSDGHILTLNFGAINSIRLLASLVRPDGATVSYTYDSTNRLTFVYELANNSAGTQPQVGYGYNGASQMAWGSSPRWNNSGATDGGYVNFSFNGSNQLTQVGHVGIVNFVPSDGTGTQIQPGYSTAGVQFYSENFAYPAGQTQLTDTDGHATNWFYDGAGRVTQTQAWTGLLWLSTATGWDPSNNLTASTDARGNETDYAYDLNGNATAVGLPSVATSQGTFRPTSLYSYDTNNNVTAYCDPVESHSLGRDWTANPGTSDTLCPSQTGATRYTWYSGDTLQPFGSLTDTYTPLGYHRQILYSTGAQGGNYGLPSDVIGDSISQADNSVRAPHTTFAYDPRGDLSSFSAGTGLGSTTLTYDSTNRPLTITDADNVTTRKCYYTSGQIQYTESASQYAADGSPAQCQPSAPANAASYVYNLDNAVTGETRHFSNVAGTTTKWYDGADRLVEVQQPQDSRLFSTGAPYDFFNYPWRTRYIYDLSQNQTVSVDGSSFHGYGNLYKTEEYAPATVQANTAPPGPSWIDVRGNSFDALDRPLAAYENAFGTTPKLMNTYDGAGKTGLLSQVQNGAGQQTILSYYATGWTQQKQYLNDGGVTPTETYTYDPNARPATVTSSQYGNETRAYDGDGRLTSDTEPTGGGLQSPAVLSYVYYADGLRKSLSVASSLVSATNAFQYSYRVDGRLQTQHLTYPMTGDFSWTYTNAGREATQSDPYAGSIIPLYDTNGTQRGTRTLVSRSTTYDSYGRVSGLTLPEGYTYGNFTYDVEDEMLQNAHSGAYCRLQCGGTVAATYSDRGELLSQTGASNPSVPGSQSANGFLCAGGATNLTPGTCPESFDARSGMVLSQCNAPYSYDGAGREVQSQSAPPPQGSVGGGVQQRGYDTENHLISQANISTAGGYYPPNAGCVPDPNTAEAIGERVTYGWGPNGHPVLIGATNSMDSPMTLHWDGDSLLFTNNTSAPTNTDIHVGKLATSDGGSGLRIVDRDMSGQQAATHTSGDFSAWSTMPPAHPATKGYYLVGSMPSDPADPGLTAGLISSPREDGYMDAAGNVFQGVRAFDGNLGQWTAPDAYAGDVHDPMSQKPYMWNRNNPLEYQDPSGFEGFCVGCQGLRSPHASGGHTNSDSYAKVEAHVGIVSISMTVTGKSGTFISLGGVASKSALGNVISGLTRGRVTAGASVMIGTIQPIRGKTSGDVVSGLSLGIGGGNIVGGEIWGNRSGGGAGVGLTTPGFYPISGSLGQHIPATDPSHSYSHNTKH